MSKQLLVVFGATGQQGGSVIEQLLLDQQLARKYAIRGLTRDPSSKASKKLAEKGVEVVKCDTGSDEDVRAALKGAHDVFLMTSSSKYLHHVVAGPVLTKNSVYAPGGGKEEERLGKHLADLVVESGAKYLIWSSMISPARLSDGKFKHVDLFESKYDVEQYIRTLPIKASFFIPASFFQNYLTQSKPRPKGDGTYALFNIYGPNDKIPLIDIAADTGKWVVPMLADPEKYNGKGIACATKQYTMPEMAEAMTKATGKTVKHVQIPVEAFESYLPEGSRQMISEMSQHIRDVGYYGANEVQELESGHQHAKGTLTTLDEFLKREPLKLD